MRLLLARHGQTDWNAAGHIQGQTDTSLNDLGRRQAADLALRLEQAGEHPIALYTSPQRRALETAQIAGRALGLTPVVVEDLREVSFGVWEGHSWEEIARIWPGEYAAYRADRLHTPPPEGESFAHLLERVYPALTGIAGTGEGTALVVSHSAVIKAVCCHMDGADFRDIQRRYLMENASWVVFSREVCRTFPHTVALSMEPCGPAPAGDRTENTEEE